MQMAKVDPEEKGPSPVYTSQHGHQAPTRSTPRQAQKRCGLATPVRWRGIPHKLRGPTSSHRPFAEAVYTTHPARLVTR